MSEMTEMRQGVKKQLKVVRHWLDLIENRVKRRDAGATEQAYMVLKTLVIMMNDGCLTPENIYLNLELSRELQATLP